MSINHFTRKGGKIDLHQKENRREEEHEVEDREGKGFF